MPFISSTAGSLSAGRRGTAFLEYNNGPICNVSGDGSNFFKRDVTVNGVRIMGAGGVGGQVAVPDAWLEKVARMFELFMDRKGTGINQTYQRRMVKTLRGDTGTYHAGFPTIQRVARGAGADYSTNFLTDAGIISWNLTNLYDTHVQNDMVWYLNSTGDGYGDGDTDAQEVIEHVFHTIHMHGLPAEDIKLYPYISSDWNTSDLYAAMEQAYDGGYWDSSGYNSPADDWKTDGDAFEVAAKEYLFLLNFCMFDYSSLWDGGSLSPEWSDSMRTPSGIQTNNPLGYAFFNTWMAPTISKPSLTTIRSIFGDGNTPAQDDPSLSGSSGYVSVGVCPPEASAWDPSTDITALGWIDASDTSSYTTSGSNLTAVTDKSSTYTMDINNTPTVSNTLNSLPVFTFENDNESLKSTTYEQVVSNSGNHWAIGVFRWDSVNNTKDSFWSIETNQSPKRDYAVSSSNSSNSWPGELDMDGLSSNRISSTIGNSLEWTGLGGLNQTQWYIVAVYFNKTGNQIGLRFDGRTNTFSPVNDYDNSLSTNQELRLMRNRSGVHLNGRLAEFFMVADLPGTGGTDMSTIEKAEGYLAHKWGRTSALPSDHPYKNSAPTS